MKIDLRVVATPHHVSVMQLHEHMRSSIAEASAIGTFFTPNNHTWYVNRVKVHTRLQGNGVGTRLLTHLINEIKRVDPDAKIIVEPGGYGSDQARQFNFYVKNGFTEDVGVPGLFTYSDKRPA